MYKLDSLAYELEFSMPYTADLFVCKSESIKTRLMITEGRNLGVPIILFIDLFKGMKYFIQIYIDIIDIDFLCKKMSLNLKFNIKLSKSQIVKLFRSEKLF